MRVNMACTPEEYCPEAHVLLHQTINSIVGGDSYEITPEKQKIYKEMIGKGDAELVQGKHARIPIGQAANVERKYTAIQS